jgi:hypothetical protein
MLRLARRVGGLRRPLAVGRPENHLKHATGQFLSATETAPIGEATSRRLITLAPRARHEQSLGLVEQMQNPEHAQQHSLFLNPKGAKH